jgi:hypothetical protein
MPVFQRRTVSIFRVEVTMLGIIPLILSAVTSALKMETVFFSKMLASTNQSAWCLNLDEHHH